MKQRLTQDKTQVKDKEKMDSGYELEERLEKERRQETRIRSESKENRHAIPSLEKKNEESHKQELFICFTRKKRKIKTK